MLDADKNEDIGVRSGSLEPGLDGSVSVVMADDAGVPLLAGVAPRNGVPKFLLK